MEKTSAHYASTLEIAQTISDLGVTKTTAPLGRLLVLGILAGVYIAFAAQASSMAAFNLLADPSTYNLGRCLVGVIFPGGLILVIIAGGELFTGNVMMLLPLVRRRIGLGGLLRNWGIVYVANFLGSLLIAWLIIRSGQLNAGDHLLGGVTIQIAAAKCGFSFIEAFTLGILCNWLVCLAIWMATGARDILGKIPVIFFPIWFFNVSGFEHSIANMYYIPAGLLAMSNPEWLAAANLSPEKLAPLTWTNYFVANLLPVTLGNMLGGGAFVAMAYGYTSNAFKK